MMIEDILSDASSRMGKTIEALRRDLLSVRTGRASPALVESIRVDYYGTPTPLKQIATISAPEARLLVIQPWDATSIGEIKKAIQKSDLGLNPSSDGNLIRLSIPPLSEERRKDLVKAVHKKTEDGRVALRNVRRDAMEMLRDLEKEKEISQDEEKRALDRLQEITDSFIEEANVLLKEKEEELLQV